MLQWKHDWFLRLERKDPSAQKPVPAAAAPFLAAEQPRARDWRGSNSELCY